MLSSYQFLSYIYNKHSFSSYILTRLVPSAHFSYIQTTLFSLVFAQYLSYIMYYSYIQNKHLFFLFLLGQIFIYIVKFLCFSYILKTIENVYFLIYIGDSSFLFCFPGYLRLFLCIGFAKIYNIKNTIFLIYLVQEIWYLYIQGIFLYINLFLLYLTQIECFAYIYIQNNTLSFSQALPRICVFSYKCFFFLYIQEIDTFSFQVLPREYSYIQ